MPYFLLIAQLCIRNVHFLNSVPIKKTYKCGHFEGKKEYWCSLDVNCFNQIKSPTKFVKKIGLVVLELVDGSREQALNCHSREKLKNVLVRKPGRKSYYFSPISS